MFAVFNYGSNNLKQLKERLGRTPKILPAKLEGYSLFFSGFSNNWGGATASIKKNKDKVCKGSIVFLSEKELKELDKFEGYFGKKNQNNTYDRKEVICKIKNKEIKAFVYIKKNKKWIDYPSSKYLTAIINHLNENWNISQIDVYNYNNIKKMKYHI